MAIRSGSPPISITCDADSRPLAAAMTLAAAAASARPRAAGSQSPCLRHAISQQGAAMTASEIAKWTTRWWMYAT